MHKTNITVGEGQHDSVYWHENKAKVNRVEYKALTIDGRAVSGVRVTCDSINGLPEEVYINGGSCLYETWVISDDVIVGHSHGVVNA